MATSSLTEAEVREIIGPPTYAYDTHRSLLALAIAHTTGPILELGLGYGSTPALHQIAERTGRQVWSYDDDEKWYADFAIMAASRAHRVLLTKDFQDIPRLDPRDPQPYWSVALVDHGQVQHRAREAGRLARCCQVVVCHDTEDPSYRWWTIWGSYKYRFDDMSRKPWSTALSNFIDFSTWEVRL